MRGGSESFITLRGRTWKALFRLEQLDSAHYLRLLDQGRSRLYDKIKLDTERTFKRDPEFLARVPEDRQIRVLNAFVNDLGTCASKGGGRVATVDNARICHWKGCC